MLYTELVIGLLKVILYALFIVIMVRIYTLPLFAVRPMYLTARAFKKALRDVVSYKLNFFLIISKYFNLTWFFCDSRCFPEEPFIIWTLGTLMLLKKSWQIRTMFVLYVVKKCKHHQQRNYLAVTFFTKIASDLGFR